MTVELSTFLTSSAREFLFHHVPTSPGCSCPSCVLSSLVGADVSLEENNCTQYGKGLIDKIYEALSRVSFSLSLKKLRFLENIF